VFEARVINLCDRDIATPPIRNVSCFGNDLKKLISYMKSICEDEFLKKYGRIMGITKVSVHNSAIRP
jgi:hypothetical protein